MKVYEDTVSSPKSREDDTPLNKYAAFEDDDKTMMSCLSVNSYEMNFDGNLTKMAGIGGVSSLPQYRRRGGIRGCFEKMLADLYEENIDFSYLYFFIFPLYIFPSVFSVLSTGIRNVWIKSGITIMNHTIGSQMITPIYPSHGTRVAAITIFPAISRPLEISGVI